MTYRISEKMLETVAGDLNRMTGNNGEPYKKRRAPNGSLIANEGCFHISYAYGGVSLHKMCKGGGVSDVFRCGHVPKRELFNMMCAYRDALRAVQNGDVKVKRNRK